MKNPLVLLSLCAICLMTLPFTSCDQGVEPIRRPTEYQWTVRELRIPGASQILLSAIWASSPSNVYVSGFSSTGGGGVFHFDGQSWRHILFSGEYNDFEEIIGFGPNEVWIVGARLYFQSIHDPIRDSAAVFRFNGSTWTQMLPSHMGVRSLQSMWATSPQNIYCGSNDGKILRYDGFRWSLDTIYPGQLSINTIGGDGNLQFAFGNTFNGSLDDSVLWFQKTTGDWEFKFYQLWTGFSVAPRFGLQSHYSPGPNLHLSSTFTGVFQFNGNDWDQVLTVDAGSINGLHGTGASNVFGVGFKGGAVMYHFDGQSWSELTEIRALLPPNTSLYDVWAFENQVLAVGSNHASAYVLHGK